MKLLIKNGRVVDPANNIDETLDILIENSRIKKIAKNISEKADRELSVTGNVVCPGFIDMHVHLREPGMEEAETIRTGGMAAAAGGFTAVACMPNTNPVNDTSSVTKFILDRSAAESPVKVYPVGAVSVGTRGEHLTEIGDLHKAGCVAISDDGNDVMDNQLMRRAMEYASMFKMPVIDHCEAADMTEGGVMNESLVSTTLGMSTIPSAAEEIMVYRNICLARITGAHVHIAHVSTEESVNLIRQAKKQKINVTCEVTPHHFTLTDGEVRSFDSNYKMKPPLRTARDVKAILKGIKDGTIDAIASDHAPHHEDTKLLEFDYSSFGIIGLETSVSLTLDKLLHKGVISINRMVEMLSTNPAKILNIQGGKIEEGGAADLTIIDPNHSHTIDKTGFKSKSRNTPFNGMQLNGRAEVTIVNGKIVYEAK